MTTITVFTFKGGTGKSTSALNIADCLARKGNRVLLADLDSQRTLSAFVGKDSLPEGHALDWLSGKAIEPICLDDAKPQRLWIIPGCFHVNQVDLSARNVVAAGLKSLTTSHAFDYVILDCATGLTPLNVQAVLAADRILIPTLSEMASLKGLAETAMLIRGDAENADKPIDVIRTRHRAQLKLTKKSDSLLIEGATEIGFNLISVVIPENIQVAEAGDSGLPVSRFAKRSRGALAYEAMTTEMRKLWGKK
jgi:chromosome partitioning protein